MQLSEGSVVIGDSVALRVCPRQFQEGWIAGSGWCHAAPGLSMGVPGLEVGTESPLCPGFGVQGLPHSHTAAAHLSWIQAANSWLSAAD